MQDRFKQISALGILINLLFTADCSVAHSQAKSFVTISISADRNQQNDLSYLKRMEGKYPNDVNLFGNNALTHRLQKLLKNRLTFLKTNWAVETPITVNRETFQAWGCQQHNCDQTNFMMVIDFKKNILYVGIRENEDVKTYSEDNSSNPIILKWATRK